MREGLAGSRPFVSVLTSVLLATSSLAATSVALAGPCTGPGAPTTTQTKCLTAVQIPGKPLGEIDVSWVDPDRAEYYLADRSNAGIDVIDTRNLTFKRTVPGFVGAVPAFPAVRTDFWAQGLNVGIEFKF